MNYDAAALALHEERRGKFATASKVRVTTKEELSLAYTPGVAAPCREIAKNPDKSYQYTSRGNLVAVISDGSAVLGLGDIGPEAAMPVMEGKAVLFKELAGIDAIPLVIAERSPNRLVRIIKAIAPSFGAINLEDISAPRCFAIEERLVKELPIPVMHDDQHGTAVVVLGALLNALRVTGKRMGELAIVVSGAGSAGVAITKLLATLSPARITVIDSKGVIRRGRGSLTPVKESLLKLTAVKGYDSLEEAFRGADVFIGVSRPGTITEEHVRLMREPIVFSLSNPLPELSPAEALAGGAVIVATGRSDHPNQINNVLAFPGIFRGVLDCRARLITEQMKVAAAHAIAALVKEPRHDRIVPSPLDEGVVPAVAAAVMEAARKEGVALNNEKSEAETSPFSSSGVNDTREGEDS